MKNFMKTLKKVILFKEIDEEELEQMLKCLGATVKKFKKDSIILLAGNEVTSVGIILSGNVKVVKENILGNQTIIAELSQTNLFAETFACAGVQKSPVTVVAASDCEVMFIGFKHIIQGCSSACTFHSKLIENMLGLMASKNLLLQDKIQMLSQRTTREKLINYFNILMGRENSNTFLIPFNRNELADYLCVDRSALSRELGKMRDAGILTFNKNRFTILKTDILAE